MSYMVEKRLYRQAKYIVAINSLDNLNRDILGICAELDSSYGIMWQHVNILARKGYLRKEKSKSKGSSFYFATEEGLSWAVSILKGENNVS